MTGRRSTRYRRISKEALPEPRIIAARRKVTGTRAGLQDLGHFMSGAEMLAQEGVLRAA